MSRYRIVLTDDHVMIRQGIRNLIELSKDILVIGEANDGLELLSLLRHLTPDLVVLDISMPNLRGIEATYEIKKTYPEIKILILSMHNKIEYVHHALAAGANGYLLKQDTEKELLSAIRTIERGGLYVSRFISDELIRNMYKTRSDTYPAVQEPLTVREREVLKLIAEGKSNKEIGDLLYVSVRTIEHHRGSLMKKLHLKNIAELIKYAIRNGYTSGV